MYKWIPFLIAVILWVVLVYSNTPYKTPDGTVYELPSECDGDLTEATKDTFVYNMPASTLDRWNRFLKIAPEGWRLYGTTISLPGLQPFIVIDESLSEKEYAKTLHHERCHIVVVAFHG